MTGSSKEHHAARRGRRAAGEVNPTPTGIRCTLIYTAAVAFVAAWWYAATLEWRAGREADRIVNREVSPTNFTRIPLAAEPPRRAAQVLMVSDNSDYRYIDALLADAVDKRPLYAPYWLDRARAAFQAGHTADAERYAARATRLWPTRPVLLWKAAMLYTRMNRPEAALATLRDFLYASPYQHERVLAIARRLEPDPSAMLHAVVPGELEQETTRDKIVGRILRAARGWNDPALGRAAWHALSLQGRRDAGVAGYYVEWMVALDRKTEALQAWRAYRPETASAGVENGGFEHPLEGGLDWRARDRNGVKLERDDKIPLEGRYSLKVTFPGNENAHFSHLRQYLPVEAAAQYTLSYAWRGRGITTRSGPYISVRGRHAGRLARTEDRWGTWDWERRELRFTAPEAEHFVEVRLHRNKTNALDNKIAGELWLDDFRLTPAGEGQSG